MSHASHEETSATGYEKWATPMLILFAAWGCIARIIEFARYNSLGLDEAALASNIVDRSWGELLGPLDPAQVAPPAFLFLTKISVLIFDQSEYAFRLLALVGSLVALGLFVYLMRRMFDAVTAAIAVALFATAGHLLYYAWQCKPYATDVTVFLILACTCITLMRGPGLTVPRTIAYALIGAISLWFSYPAVFALAGIGGAHLVCQYQYKDWKQIRLIVAAIAIWIGSFAVLYFVHMLPVQEHGQFMGRMQDYWTAGFMPLPPTSLGDLAWFRETFLRFFWMPGGFRLTGLAGFTLLAGCAHLYFHQRFHLGLLALPIVAALLASGLEKYPFEGRLILFAAPSLFALMAVGMGAILRALPPRYAVAGLLLVAMLVLSPTVRSVRKAAVPHSTSQYKSAIQYVSDHAEPGDLLYIRSADQYIFRFSQRGIDLAELSVYTVPFDVSLEHRDVEHLTEQLPALEEAGRVWFPFAYDAAYTIAPTMEALNDMATLQDEFHAAGTSVYLYTFDGSDE